MDTRKLGYFLAVLEHRHFGRAARSLRVSQQAVSAAVARLEGQLRVRLFDRGPQGVSPTEYAGVLENHARLVLSESRLAQAEIAAIRGGTRGQVRVGVGLSFGTRIVPEALARFREQLPGLTPTFVVDATVGLYRRLERGELDLVVSAPPTGLTPPANVTREALFLERDAVLVRAEHPLAATPECVLAALQECSWIVSALPLGGGWERICTTFVDHGLEPPVNVVRTDSITLSDALMLAGDYVGVLSWEAHGAALRSGQLVELKVPELADTRVAYIAYRKGVLPSAGTLAFIRAIRSVVPRTPATPRTRTSSSPRRSAR